MYVCTCLLYMFILEKTPNKQKQQTTFLKYNVIPYFYFLYSNCFSPTVGVEEFFFFVVLLGPLPGQWKPNNVQLQR